MQGTTTVKKVSDFIAEHNLVAAGDLVILGVSGGPDSVALLHIMLTLAPSLGFRLHVAHLHHGLRAEADLDQQLVEDLCREWRVPLSVERLDVAALAAAQEMSVEEAGREARYRFLQDLRLDLKGDRIATAHHRGDQAETVLMHLIQGTGARGLQGILPLRDRIIRPLLDLSREEIMAYLCDNGLPYRIDSSNFDNNYLRNRIRWELLPLLERRFNPAIVQTLCRLAAVMREENRFWDEQIKQILPRVVTRDNAVLRADIEFLRELSPALRRRCLHDILHQAGSRRVTWNDVERVTDLMAGEGSSRRVPVSGDLWVKKSYAWLEIGPEEIKSPGFCYPLEVPGSVLVPEIGLKVTASLVTPPAPTTGEEYLFDWEQMKKPLYIRSRRPGDVFQPRGMNGHRKLKKYFIDQKIPRAERDRIGILAAEDEIYWVIGHRQAEAGRVNAKTKTLLKVQLSRLDK